jgi:hypothetical protein
MRQCEVQASMWIPNMLLPLAYLRIKNVWRQISETTKIAAVFKRENVQNCAREDIVKLPYSYDEWNLLHCGQ